MNKKVILILISFLIITIVFYYRYKPCKELSYNNKKVEIVLDRWYSVCVFCPYRNSWGGMNFEPHYKVYYNNNCILQFKLDILEIDEGINELYFNYIYTEEDNLIIFVDSFGCMYKIKLPLNNKLNKLSKLEVKAYAYDEDNKKSLKLKNGNEIEYNNLYIGNDAIQMLLYHVRGY